MNLIRLGDRIEIKEREPRLAQPFRTADNLAQRVLNPMLSEESMNEYYLQSHPLAPAVEFADQLPEGTSQLGVFETLFTGKLLNPPLPVFCIVGAMGCGKTTTMEYVAMGLVRRRAHCGRCPGTPERMVAHIDFNDHIELHEYIEEGLTERLLSVICDELRARVRIQGVITSTFSSQF